MDPFYNYDYGNEYSRFGDTDMMAVFAIFLGIIAIAVLIEWAIGIAWYILRSIGLYKISENRGMSGSALAWIPFIGFYRTGAIADDITARNGGRSYYRHILLIGGIVNVLGGIGSWLMIMLSGVFSQVFRGRNAFGSYGYGFDGRYYDHSGLFAYWGVSLLLSLLSLAVFVFTIIALNKIYQGYRPMNATLWTILSVIFPFMQAIFPFILRNAVPVDQWNAQGYYPMQNTMPNQNWQAPPPPQYPPYGQQPPVNGGYPPQNQNWQAPPENAQYQPPANDSYQPPVAPNPPEAWEIEPPAPEAPPRAPWEQNNNGDN